MPETLRTLSVALGELRLSVDHRFDQVDKRFEQVDQRFDAMDRRIDEPALSAVDEHFVEQRRYTEFAFEAVNNRILIARTPVRAPFRSARREDRSLVAIAFPRAQAHVTRNVLVSRLHPQAGRGPRSWRAGGADGSWPACGRLARRRRTQGVRLANANRPPTPHPRLTTSFSSRSPTPAFSRPFPNLRPLALAPRRVLERPGLSSPRPCPGGGNRPSSLSRTPSRSTTSAARRCRAPRAIARSARRSRAAAMWSCPPTLSMRASLANRM